MTLDEFLAEIDERSDKATKGPWTVHLPEAAGYVYVAGDFDGDRYELAEIGPPVEHQNANGNFIAHAREDVLRLRAVVTKLREQRNAWVDIVGQTREAKRENIQTLDAEVDALLDGEDK